MSGHWVEVAGAGELESKGVKLVKVAGKQIALFRNEAGTFACNNRCPHEGYPLSEGSLAGCVLTCNWHNWKFDLASGETLTGGDRLRRYPTRMEKGAIFVDIADPPAAERRATALATLAEAFRRHDSDRMARELARLVAAGGSLESAILEALERSHERFEFGMSHAQAAAADWLLLGERFARDDAERLVPTVELLAHLSWDTLREPAFPYPTALAEWNANALADAIEAEDEERAVALLRGAIEAGVSWREIEAPLGRAALAHYQDFGHAAIYVVKAGELMARLGNSLRLSVLLPLVRSLIYANREDLIPEFRDYRPALEAWDGRGGRPVAAEDFTKLGVKQALARALESSGDVKALYRALFGAAASSLLQFDIALQDRSDNPVGQNVGWLDFTHAVTFGDAARQLAERQPVLWPAALLQLACFAGRNAGFHDRKIARDDWRVDDAEAFFETHYRKLFDHGQREHIVAAHLIKTLGAAESAIAADSQAPFVPDLLAALNRFLHSPLKRRHALREARQALAFVAAEG